MIWHLTLFGSIFGECMRSFDLMLPLWLLVLRRNVESNC
jgi:hypothetical protein